MTTQDILNSLTDKQLSALLKLKQSVNGPIYFIIDSKNRAIYLCTK